ncbi:S-layer homology domain-containing protein [Intestinimonas butyriciproducens]|uniref:S-layer homology domain-containing protein n=1 Tax=Intestinimonas butyriciproducens TaxID=1297617 RepID=UPI00195AE5C7|nr:S-layer homology domain-containing protein [Intestinimonas butyriciproducens]MBM6917471.1 S-layer homology domain-containing protein [Intestinimonas butyriciproducens]
MGMRVNVNGRLVVRDSSQDGTGKIVSASNYDCAIWMGSTGVFWLESGTLQGTTGIDTYSFGSQITILGGTVLSTAKTRSTTYVAVDAQNAASLVIGCGNAEQDSKIVIDGGMSYGVNLPNNDQAQTEIKGGWVSSLCGTLRDLEAIQCKLGEPIDDMLPAGKISKPYTDEDTGKIYYQIGDLTDDADVAATIGEDKYASVKAAAAFLEDGETLTLRKDFTINEQLRITAANVTLDLNGYDYTNTYSYGIYAYLWNAPAEGSTFLLKNSSDHTSTVTAKYQPVYLYGPSKGIATLYIEGDIVLHRESGDLVKLSRAQMAYSESAAAMIGNGGFKATASDGNSYIYGGYAEAAEADVNNTAVLLNDYSGMANLTVPKDKNYVVDLNGYTYTVTNALYIDGAIDLSNAGASLTVKNGKLVSEMTDGAFLNGDRTSLTLENVDLSVPNNTYGIVTQGTHSQISVSLTGGSVTAGGDSVGIYFPSDNSTLVIDGTTITGDTAVAVKGGTTTIRGNASLHGTGAKHIPDEPQGSGVNLTGAALYLEGNYGWDTSVRVEGGTFVSDQADAVLMLFDDENYRRTISISGGYFTSDPSAYVAENKAALPSDTAGYAFMVGNAVQTEVEPAVGEPKVDMSLINEGDKEEVQKAAESVTASGELAAAANQVIGEVTEQQKEKAVEAIKAEGSGVNVGNKPVTVYAQTYLDIKPTGYDASAGTMILEIVPMYRVVATTAADAESIQVYDPEAEDNTGANAVALAGSEQKLTNIQTMTISITLPVGFPTENLYVKHMKDNQLVGYHTAKVDGTTLTFLNDKGFSTFEIKRDTRTAKVKFGDDILTLTPADVNQDLPTAISAGQVFSGWSFEGINGTYKTLTDDLLTALSTAYGDGSNGNIKAVAQFYTPSTGGNTATSYSITVEKAENGTVTASTQSAAKGNAVTITVEPNEGYVLDTLTATDASGNEVALTKVSDSQYSFTMPGSKVTVKATFKADEAESDSLPFTDVNSEDWYYDAVKYAYDNGMMNGMEETLFAPSFNLTRGMLVTILYRLEEDHTYSATLFPDVASDAYYANPVAWASGNGIVKGYEDGTFGPEKNITREQMAQILYNYAVYKGIDTSVQSDLSAFTDGANTSEWAETAMKWAVGNGLLQGYNGQLNPNGTATRAEVAQILMNFCENIAK